MCDKVDLSEIKKIPQKEFKQILHSWMDQKQITQTMQKKLRKQLVTDFQKTELARRLTSENNKNLFNSKEYVVDTLQAEHLYTQNNHFTLSVFFTETRHPTLLPNFEKDESFRFQKNDVQELTELLGLTKSDKITRRILNVYKSSNESLLSVLLKELITAHNSTETKTVATQTETICQQPLDISIISSKSKKLKKKKNHGLVSKEYKGKKSKKLKDVGVITQSLEKMSSNIGAITNKLDEFKRNPSHDESKTIIGHVGTIMTQLNGCISNFETLCREIKQVNETRNRNFDEWMDDLQNSENGRRFLKKLQKSFSRVMDEEKAKLRKDFKQKFERERRKLSKLSRSSAPKAVDSMSEVLSYPEKITKEINEIFEKSCQAIKTAEREDELNEKNIELETMRAKLQHAKKVSHQSKLQGMKTKTTVDDNGGVKLNLNDCRQIHSADSSSDPPYGSNSFESDASDDIN